MATKNLKSVGSQLFYIQQTVKMCPYPCDISQGTIDVPQDELETDNLAVAHLLSMGFKIQSCIPGSVTKREVFNPQISLTPLVVERAKNEFMIGDTFKIKSSECELVITRIEKGKVHLHYTNRPKKHDLLISEEQLKKSLSWQNWERC